VTALSKDIAALLRARWKVPFKFFDRAAKSITSLASAAAILRASEADMVFMSTSV